MRTILGIGACFITLLGGAVASPALASGTFTPISNMTVARSGHTATLLRDGRVLITGGFAGGASYVTRYQDSAELYDPATGSFTATGSMLEPRTYHSATLLPSGQVFIVGGQGSAELYDPATGRFRRAGAMRSPVDIRHATLLLDGKVLVAGSDHAELYDPGTDTFSMAAPYATLAYHATATLLPDGRVFFVGDDPAQIYDPVRDVFSVAGSTHDVGIYGLEQHTATLLQNGKVLVAGGSNDEYAGGRLSLAELYDPATGTFTATSPMLAARDVHAAVRLGDGTVMVSGGEGVNGIYFAGSLASAEIYDPATACFSAAGDMSMARGLHQSTLLGNGDVLITGGDTYCGIGCFYGSTASAELYRPGIFTPPVPSPSVLTTPPPGSTLSGTTVTFSWTSGNCVADHYFAVGTSVGGSQVYGEYEGTRTGRTVIGLPSDGSTVYVRLTSYLNGGSQTTDYTYTATGSPPPPPPSPAVLTTPPPGSTLSDTTVTFSWTLGNGVAERYFEVGTSAGGSQIYGAYQGAGTSRTVTGLPSDGSTVYVRLLSYINGEWQTSDYTYTAMGSSPPPPMPPGPSVLTAPPPGSTLSGPSVMFSWTSGSSVAERYLMVGTTMGGAQIYGAYQGAATSRTVNGIPTDGSTIHLRLMSYMGGVWEVNDYTYTASSGGGGGGGAAPTPSVMQSPAPGSTLGSTATFTWSAGSGVAERYLSVGTTLGGSQIYVAYQGAALTRTVSGLPAGSVTVYVRLMSFIDDAWRVNDYTYMSAP